VETVGRFGRLAAFAALAGAGIYGHALDLGPVDWRSEVTAKLGAVLNLARSARRHLAASDAGRIVTVAAPTARDPDPAMAAVSAARAAVASLTRSLALDLTADGILVNAVSVGLVDTARQRARYERSAADVP
jgi:NAD(P)-dependent dehydrogenase (short-subunit alcohol dehydrogenase family)